MDQGRNALRPCSNCDRMEPRMIVLRCHHSLCLRCLGLRVRVNMTNMGRCIKCPDCPHAEPLPPEMAGLLWNSDWPGRIPNMFLQNGGVPWYGPQQPRMPEPDVANDADHDGTEFSKDFWSRSALSTSIAILLYCILEGYFRSHEHFLNILEQVPFVSLYRRACISPMLLFFLSLLEAAAHLSSTCRTLSTCLPTLFAVISGLVNLLVCVLFYFFVTHYLIAIVQLVRRGIHLQAVILFLGVVALCVVWEWLLPWIHWFVPVFLAHFLFEEKDFLWDKLVKLRETRSRQQQQH